MHQTVSYLRWIKKRNNKKWFEKKKQSLSFITCFRLRIPRCWHTQHENFSRPQPVSINFFCYFYFLPFVRPLYCCITIKIASDNVPRWFAGKTKDLLQLLKVSLQWIFYTKYLMEQKLERLYVWSKICGEKFVTLWGDFGSRALSKVINVVKNKMFQ